MHNIDFLWLSPEKAGFRGLQKVAFKRIIDMEIIRYVVQDGSEPLTDWLHSLRDLRADIAIRRRLERLAAGNFGNTRTLRDGISELKIDVGPGYRVYYARNGQTIILLLCGGDKRTQDADIARAIGYWEDWKRKNRRSS